MNQPPQNVSLPESSLWAASSPTSGVAANHADALASRAWLEQALFSLCVVYALLRGY